MLQFYKNNEFEKALNIFNLLEVNLSSFGNEIKQVDKGKLLESAGLCYFRKEYYKKSEDYYNKAIKYYSNKRNLNQIHQNYADLFYKSNDINKALNSIRLARENARKNDYLAMMKVNNTEALIYSKMKKYKKAKSFSFNALEQAILSKSKFEEATARVNLVKILIKLNDFEQVKTMLDLSKKLSIETENNNALISTYFYKAEIDNKLAMTNESKRNIIENNIKLNIDSAKVYYKKAYDLAQNEKSKSFEAKILLKLGEILSISSDNKEREQGKQYLSKCVNLSKFYNFKDIYYRSQLKLSNYMIISNEISKAKETLSTLIKTIIKDITYAYDNSLDETLYNVIDEAFIAYISLPSSSLTNESETNKKIFKLLQQKEYIEIQDMMNNMNLNFVDFNMNFYYNDMIYSKNKIKKLNSSYINSVQFNFKNIQDSLLLEISKETKIYKDLTQNSPTHKKLLSNNLLSIDDVKNSLSDDDILLNYYGSNSNIFCLIFTNKAIKNIKISDKIEDIQKISKLNSYLNSSLDISSISKELFNILVEPIYSEVSDKKNLIFHSNIDILNNFPFDLLIIKDEFVDKETLDNNKFLIDHFNIAQLSYIFEINKNNKVLNKNYSKIYSFVNAYSAVTEDLKYADKEFNSLKWEYDIAEDYSKKEAFESAFYDLSFVNSEEKQLFHFPTHTFINKKDTLESYISLVGDKDFDGKLGYSEILEYDNRNRDIVLSGCETGGKIGYDYKKYFDISSAFILSGSESVVATRWKSNDLVTAVLMKRYFRYLREGNSKIEALTKAKRVVKNYVKSYPYYWAGFKISGDYR